MQQPRRRVLVACVAALLTAPLHGRAQSTDKPRRIGFLSSETADSEGGQLARKQIPEALKRRGWTEGGNLLIEWRWANGKIADLPELAADLVRSNVEIIVARTNRPIQAAMKATQTTPIVMLNGNFPVESALSIASRNRVAMSLARRIGHRPRSLPSTFRSSRNWRHAPIGSRCRSMRTGRATRRRWPRWRCKSERRTSSA